ncbi:MAG TPA: TadE/TadG family type IV pilus assembly protein [Xanthomonadales bacterium]|nr:TadE/TadG family type IV pilus assembly protein [Xanthomonadales bacterium]
MRNGCRGSALTETALAIGVVMTVLLGTLQLGILGSTQTAADGAAFVAAHTYAQNPTRGTSYAVTAATSAFTKIPASALTVTTAGGIVTAKTATTAAGINVPGAPATVAMQSSAAERVPAAAGASPGAFSVTATLKNYRDASGNPNSSYPLGIAQTQGTGIGTNLRFTEWECRQAYYSTLVFPTKRPVGFFQAGPWSFFDASYFYSPLEDIYEWDDGTACDLSA